MLKSFYHLEIDEIKIFVDITQSTFKFANLLDELSAVHWQLTL